MEKTTERIIVILAINLLLTLLALIIGIVALYRTEKEQPKDYPIIKSYEGWYTTASYYAEPLHGRQTANQEIFNMYAFTAAHPTLPFGTYLQVTNINNDEWTIVVINDRGPFKMESNGNVVRPLEPHPIRGIDLSKAAFERIADINDGLAEVYIEILTPD
jgi:rare lipoprotein A